MFDSTSSEIVTSPNCNCNFRDLTPSCDASSFSVSQAIPCSMFITMLTSTCHWFLFCDIQIYSTTPTPFFKIHFNIIPSSMPKSSTWPFTYSISLFSYFVPHAPPILIFCDLINLISGREYTSWGSSRNLLLLFLPS